MARRLPVFPLAALIALLAAAYTEAAPLKPSRRNLAVGRGVRLNPTRSRPIIQRRTPTQAPPAAAPAPDKLRHLAQPRGRKAVVTTALKGPATAGALNRSVPDLARLKPTLPSRSLAGHSVRAPLASASSKAREAAKRLPRGIAALPWTSGVFVSPIHGAPLYQGARRAYQSAYMVTNGICASPNFTLARMLQTGVTRHLGGTKATVYLHQPAHRGTYLLSINLVRADTGRFPEDATVEVLLGNADTGRATPWSVNSEGDGAVVVMALPHRMTPFKMTRASGLENMEAVSAVVTLRCPRTSRTMYFGGVTVTEL